jgi:hypothetical protein
MEIRINGEKVWDTDEQVTGVAVQSARGELYRAGISTEGVLDLRVDVVRPGDPPRLDQVEAQQRRETAARVEGQVSGPSELESDRSKIAQQTIGDSTLHPGGENTAPVQATPVPPSVDLASGLDPDSPNFTEVVSARVDAFNEHGDAQKAIDDNPADGGSSVGETGPGSGETDTNTLEAEPGFNLS